MTKFRATSLWRTSSASYTVSPLLLGGYSWASLPPLTQQLGQHPGSPDLLPIRLALQPNLPLRTFLPRVPRGPFTSGG